MSMHRYDSEKMHNDGNNHNVVKWGSPHVYINLEGYIRETLHLIHVMLQQLRSALLDVPQCV